MDQIKVLQEKRAKEAAEMQKIHELAKEEKRGFTPEEQTEWDKRTKAYDSLNSDIERLEKFEKLLLPLMRLLMFVLLDKRCLKMRLLIGLI